MTAADRAERAVLNLILLGVGVASAYVSWGHVHGWTMAHTRPDTHTSIGWVNAAISELVPLAAALVIRRRRAAGQTYATPLVILLVFGAYSLSAQVAQAPSSLSGWIQAALPAVGVFAIAKLVLSLPATAPVTAPVAVTVKETAPARVRAPRPPADPPAVTPPAATAVAAQDTPPADGATPIQRRREREAAVAQYLTDNPGTTVAGMARALQIPRPTVADIVGKLPTGAEQETA